MNLNTIVTSDNIEYLRLFDGCIDLVVTSPPYDGLRDYNGSSRSSRTGEQLLRVLKDGGMCVMVIQDSTKDFAKTLLHSVQLLTGVTTLDSVCLNVTSTIGKELKEHGGKTFSCRPRFANFLEGGVLIILIKNRSRFHLNMVARQ